MAKISPQLIDGLSIHPSNWCVPTTIKRRVTIPASMARRLKLHVECAVKSWNVLAHHWKGRLSQLKSINSRRSSKIDESPAQRAVVQNVDSRQGVKIVNSEIKLEDHNSYLDRYSLKSSCHLGETGMRHTLAQNRDCESCCGVHLTCKNDPVTPDRKGWLKGPEKQWEALIAIASAVAIANKARKQNC